MEANLIQVAKEGLYLVLKLSAAPVLTALVVGLTVSLVQATTQIQEQTLTFVPKLVAIILVLIFLGEYGLSEVMAYTKNLFQTLIF
jgi:flagellar biosynthesis protein FliQ